MVLNQVFGGTEVDQCDGSFGISGDPLRASCDPSDFQICDIT